MGLNILMQWKWRCTFRDAYYVCKLFWPYAHTKLPKDTTDIRSLYSGSTCYE